MKRFVFILLTALLFAGCSPEEESGKNLGNPIDEVKKPTVVNGTLKPRPAPHPKPKPGPVLKPRSATPAVTEQSEQEAKTDIDEVSNPIKH